VKTLARSLSCAFLLVVSGGCLGSQAAAQTVESVGSRALGMGGAFVAVANDSSATWWNPAGLAAGPFLDVAIARTSQPGWTVALATPPFGVSYYRLRITDIGGGDPTAADPARREDRRVGVGQFGATILHTLVTGIHAGTTLKYVHGDGDRSFDLDAGVLAVVGAIRVGGLVRNVREPALGEIRLPRQLRLGAAYDGEAIGAPPLVVSLDADVRRYETAAGERRVVAAGVEHWLRPRRFAIRAGARVNTAGERGGSVTAGASVSPRAGMFIDAHVAAGGDTGADGWGLAARVYF
jgi:hypothetical protein